MREKKEIVINDRGNDLTFVIEEMPSSQLESWIIRTILLLAKSGVEDIPLDGDSTSEMTGASALKYISEKGIGVLGGVDYDKAKPLLDELLCCCSYKTDGSCTKLNPQKVDAIVGDVSTLMKLKMEALKVNFSFFKVGDISKSNTSEVAKSSSVITQI